MRFRKTRGAELLRAIIHEARAEKLTFLAGSIAYHAFISLLPLLLLVLTVVQRTENIGLRDSVLRIMEAVLTAQASAVLRQGLADADTSVSVLGIGFLVWGALRIFRGLDTAFSDIYETEGANTFLDQLRDGIVLLVTVTLAILAASLAGRIISLSGDGAATELVSGAATALGLFVVFYPMYYIFPDTECTPVEVVPGTVFAAVGVTVAQAAFTAFQSGATGRNLIASVLVLLTWLYVVGLVILLGAVVNAVFSNRSRDVDIKPVLGGIAKQRAIGKQVDREALLGDLNRLVADLAESGEFITIRADGRRVEIARPQRARVEHSEGLFDFGSGVSLVLRWWPEDGSGRDSRAAGRTATSGDTSAGDDVDRED